MVFIKNRVPITIFGGTFVIDWTLEVGQCSKCNASVHHDGRQHGLVNWNDKYLFACEFLDDYLDLYSRTAVNSLWKSTVQRMVKRLRRLPRARSRVLQLEAEWNGFSCKLPSVLVGYISLLAFPDHLFRCCDNPDINTADGIVLSVESHRLRKLTQPWVLPPMTHRATTTAERAFPSLSASDSLFLDTFTSEAALMDPELDPQIHVAALSSPSLAISLLAELCTSSTGHTLIPAAVRPFANSLRKSVAPIAQLLPMSVKQIVDAFVQTGVDSQRLRQDLSRNAPILSRLYSACNLHASRETGMVDSDHVIIVKLRELLRFMSASCNSLFTQPLPPDFIADLPVDLSTKPPFAQLLDHGSFFPNNPIQRCVRHIKLPGESRVTPCNKEAKEKGRLGPGVLLFWCAVHGKCIGFQILNSAESPRSVFEVLVSTCPPAVPRHL